MTPSLSSQQLDAFLELAREANFSRAARNLSVTQSALSQRIQKLEEELGGALVVREPSGVRPTALGEELLRYCQAKQRLEEDFRARHADAAVGGTLRLAGYSTVVRSLLMPALAPLLRAAPARRHVEVTSREMRELPPLLKRGSVDYLVLNYALEDAALETKIIGHEENVLVEGTKHAAPEHVYLDHDADDAATEEYLRAHGKLPAEFRRHFVDDAYGILEGVALGWGRAVLPRHLLRPHLPVREVRGYRVQKNPIVLHYYRQSLYPRLHTDVLRFLDKL